MKAWLQLVSLVVGLIPQVIAMMQAIETAVPVSGAGAAKKAAVGDLLKRWMDGATALGATFEQAWPLIEGTVDTFAKLFNTIGAFKTSKPADPAV
jgi:hypothetical protein